MKRKPIHLNVVSLFSKGLEFLVVTPKKKEGKGHPTISYCMLVCFMAMA